jgi:drug/metabolite transporter (DMT)-like permease
MSDNTSSTQHKAGLFDIRIIIGGLLGIYGLILLLTGLVSEDTQVESSKAINVWVGIGLLVASAAFVAWARLRPIVVPDEVPAADDRPAH